MQRLLQENATYTSSSSLSKDDALDCWRDDSGCHNILLIVIILSYTWLRDNEVPKSKVLLCLLLSSDMRCIEVPFGCLCLGVYLCECMCMSRLS